MYIYAGFSPRADRTGPRAQSVFGRNVEDSPWHMGRGRCPYAQKGRSYSVPGRRKGRYESDTVLKFSQR
jgi:hypothetical protein